MSAGQPVSAGIGTALRAGAALIAVAALVDPAITTSRVVRPEIAVIARASDSVAARRVVDHLDDGFTVIDGALGGVAATVVVGNELPHMTLEPATPTFFVVPDRPATTIISVAAPPRVAIDSRVDIPVVVRSTSSSVALRANGVVVDQVSVGPADSVDERRAVLRWTPATLGPARLTVSVEGDQAARSDVVTDVVDRRWNVLFVDQRPSWMSTFVRRAVERDARFAVTSRVVASRGIAVDAGRPPASLDAAAVQAQDVIVVGAPELLSGADVRALEAHLRRRAGSAILLFDRIATGPYTTLIDVARWDSLALDRTVDLRSVALDSATTIRASELMWPASMPVGAVSLLQATPTARPVLWRTAVGAGQLIVSGALDAWRFRDAQGQSFDRFWQATIADAAVHGMPALRATIDAPALEPGGSATITASIRDVDLGLRAASATIEARLEDGERSTPVRLWPDPLSPGRFSGVVRAPVAPGVYHVAIASGDDQARVPLVVDTDVRRLVRDDRGAISDVARAHGGIAVSTARLDSLTEALDAVIDASSRAERWHPMRSPWWILPFALALSAEWWLRRRSGQR
jgi:hypothetical protein